MELEIFKSNFGYYNFRMNNGRPTEEMVNYLKSNGYRWSRNHNAWYPATNEAKEKNLHEDFVADFQKRFFEPATQRQKSFGQELFEREQRKTEWRETHGLADQALSDDNNQTEQSVTITLDEQGVKNIAEFSANSAIANERKKIAQLEALIAELQAERKRDKEKIAQYEFELANSRDEGLSDFYTQQEQEEIDNDAEWERENSLTDEEERSIIENYETPKLVQAIEEHEDMAQSMTGEQMFNALHEIAEMAAREDEPKAEKAVLREAKKETDENLMLTPEEIELAKSVLPTTQYVSTLRYAQGEEREFFIKTLKGIANSVKNAPKLYETDGAEQHPIVLRYFHPTGTETLVTEIGKDGEAYGYQCLNGDYEMEEWGYIDLNKVKNIPGMEADYHVEEGMTVERWLYKEQPEMFQQYAKFAGVEENEQEKSQTQLFDGKSEIVFGETTLPAFSVLVDGKMRSIENAVINGHNKETGSYFVEANGEKIELPKETFNTLYKDKIEQEQQKARLAEGKTIVFEDKEQGIKGTEIPEWSMYTTKGLESFKGFVAQKFNQTDNTYILSNGDSTITVSAARFKEISAPERFENKFDENSPAWKKLCEQQYKDFFEVRDNTAYNFKHNLSVYCRKEANSPVDALHLAKEIISKMSREEQKQTKKLLKSIANENETTNELIARIYHESVKEQPLNEDYMKSFHPEKVVAWTMPDTVSGNGQKVDNDPALIKGENDRNLRIGMTLKNVDMEIGKVFGKGKDIMHFDELKVISATQEGNSITVMDGNKSYFKLPRDTVLNFYKEQQRREMKQEQKHSRSNTMTLGYA